jgi:2-(1,2-epoxy-1,2-dihydrophenyl)acetyl-CoA isomerase
MTLLVKDDGAVRTLVLSNPGKKNALRAETYSQLRDVLQETGYDESVRVVVLTGEGEDFCSGADVSGSRTGHPLRRMRAIAEAVTALHDLPQPAVARVDGVAVGAGLGLALACDFVVASSRSRFSAIFARRGLSLDAGTSWTLPQSVGLLQAKRLALLAELVDAEEALRVGLATYVVEQADLDARVADLCARLAAGPPAALAQTKAMLNQAAQGTLKDALDRETVAQAVNFATDAPAAFEAFRERREPDFTGEFRVPGPAATATDTPAPDNS